MKSKPKRILISITCGVIVTTLLTVIAFTGTSRTWGCTFVWQACLVQAVIHTPGDFEATPIDLFAFLFGILLGVPIYSLLTYAALSRVGSAR
jgi:hypothetical protein